MTMLGQTPVGEIAGLVVREPFVTEGVLRRTGEILPAAGNVQGLVALQYAHPATREALKHAAMCGECQRKFVDAPTLEAHKARDHDPRLVEMQAARAAEREPEPGPRDDAGSWRDANSILPMSVINGDEDGAEMA